MLSWKIINEFNMELLGFSDSGLVWVILPRTYIYKIMLQVKKKRYSRFCVIILIKAVNVSKISFRLIGMYITHSHI